MLTLVVLLAAAAAAAPMAEPELPFLPDVYQNRSSFFDASQAAAALARFHSIVGEKHPSISVPHAAELEPALPVLLSPEAILAQAAMAKRLEGAVYDKPSIAEINAPIAAYLQGGDIMRAPSSILAKVPRTKRGAPVITAKRFPKTQPIGFYFDAAIPESLRQQIRNITAKMTANTCLTFKENATAGTPLQVVRGGGCWSYVGIVFPDNQQVSIDSGCEFDGIIGHEFSHALGLDHTQNRKDRDQYMTININAVKSGYAGNYQKIADAANENFGVPYEFGSDMHYGPYDFSATGAAVMIPNESGYENTMGQRKYLTFNDYKLINLLYKCSENCPSQMVCQNGGYPSPRDCNACVCNDFYTGPNCQTPKAAPIAITDAAPGATSYTTPYNVALYTSGNNYNWDMFQKDTPKIITAPAGRKIRVTIDKIYAAYGGLACYAGCQFVGLEFVDGDLTNMGKIYCCTKDQGFSFVSKTNVIGYKAYSSPGMPLQATASYTVV